MSGNTVGYSADVRMHLSFNGHTLRIGQLGPDFVILDDPIDHVPTQAEISVSIDGCLTRWNVVLPDGVSAQQPWTSIGTRRISVRDVATGPNGLEIEIKESFNLPGSHRHHLRELLEAAGFQIKDERRIPNVEVYRIAVTKRGGQQATEDEIEQLLAGDSQFDLSFWKRKLVA